MLTLAAELLDQYSVMFACPPTTAGRPFLERQIKKGQLLLVTGPVRYYHGKQIVPREFIVLAEPDEGEGTGDAGLVLPVYPATEGLTHRQIRALVQQHLDELLALVADPHPPAFRATHNLIELRPALERPIRHGDRLRPLRGEVRCAELDHFARANQQDTLLRNRWKDALGKLHRSRRHGAPSRRTRWVV